MTAHSAVAVAAAHGPGSRTRINRFGLWLFLFSDGLLFAVMATGRFYMAGTDSPEGLAQWLGLLITSILLLSSLTAYRAETAISHGNIAQGRRMLALTVLLGVIFVGGVVVEWSEAEWSIREGYGTAFYSMTGMHATHVVTGILFLIIAFRLAGRGRYNHGNTWGAQAIVVYWHFVDVVWVFFYPILYLIQ